MILHNGIFTLRNKSTGEYRTFRIRTQKEDSNFAPSKRIIGLLTGCDNTNDYKGFGFVEDDQIVVWQRFRGQSKKSHFEMFAVMLWGAVNDPTSKWAINYELMVEEKCRRCNRTLSTPESIERGIGPECATKI